jgi:endonuclease III
MAVADIAQIRQAIAGGGLEATRAKHLQEVVATLKTEFGRVSLHRLHKWSNQKCLDFLTRLRGVGKKSALCVMMYGLNRKVFPADAHCIRILTRLGVLPEGLEHRPAQIQLLKKVPGDCRARPVDLHRAKSTMCLLSCPPVLPVVSEQAARGLGKR